MNCLEIEKLSRHSKKTTLYKRLDIMAGGDTELRMSSAHISSHRGSQSQGFGFPTKHHLTLDEKPERRVGFKSITVAMPDNSSCKKLTLISNNKPRSHLKQRSQVISIKTFKSLDSSFVCGANDTERAKSRRTLNPSREDCSKISQEILKKLQIFEDSKFCPKQVMGWIQEYFQQERSVLSRIFLKPRRKKQPHQKKEADPELERDIDIVNMKIASRQKDSFLMCQRFVSVAELTLFSQFLQNLYIQKNKVKMKEIEKCLKTKVTQICQQIRQEQNTEFLLALRKKPVEITNFMQDLKHFQNKSGSLKRIGSINLNRFKMLNETDIVVESHIRSLNEQVKPATEIIIESR